MESRKIKPEISEISLAFNPASGKSFFLMKEEEKMDELIKALLGMKDVTLEKEAEVDKVLADMIRAKTLSKEASDGIKGVLKILSKHKTDLPAGIMSTLSKLVPAYEVYASSKDTEVEAATKKAAIYAEAKKDLETAIRKELETTIRKELDRESDSDLRKEVEDLRKEVDTAKKLAVDESKKRRMLEVTASLKDLGIPGDLDKMSKIVLSLDDISSDLSKDFTETLSDFSTRLKAAGILGELGAAGSDGVSNTAYEKMKKLVEEKLAKDTNTSPAAAWKAIVKANPVLYKEYLDKK